MAATDQREVDGDYHCASNCRLAFTSQHAIILRMLINDVATKLCKRFNQTGHAHELTFSCYKRQPFLLSPRVCDWLIESLEQARTSHEFDLWAYVFMPDHVHLLIFPRKQPYSISEILKAVKMPVATKAVEYLRTQNPAGLAKLATGQQYRRYKFWQKGGGYDRNIMEPQTLVNCAKYIHNNPVRKGLCAIPENWRYSSAASWLGTGDSPLKIDKETWPVT